jgi:uncharacterized protein (TIGR03437 family)
LRDRYLEALHHASEAQDWLVQEARRAYLMIRQAAIDDPFKIRYGPDATFVPASNEDFEQASSFVANFLDRRPTRVATELEIAGLQHQGNAADMQTYSAGNYAMDAKLLTPGSLARLRMSTSSAARENASSVPLPQKLGGISLMLGNRYVPLLSVTPNEVVFQVPWETPCGPQLLHVDSGGVESHSICVEVRPNVPGIISVYHADWSPVDALRPAVAGETLVLYVTGLGNPEWKPPTGEPAPVGRLAEIKDTVAASVDGRPAKVIFAGLAPGLVGVQTVLLEWPGGVFPSKQASLVLTANGEAGARYLVNVP